MEEMLQSVINNGLAVTLAVYLLIERRGVMKQFTAVLAQLRDAVRETLVILRERKA